MADNVYRVRFEPMGVEMDVGEGETVLDAAFRQGIAVMHGCKEGQCSACKSRLVEGDVELLKYSTFALPDYERDADHILLCRTLAYSDVTVELLNFDEELMSRAIAVKSFDATVVSVAAFTRDIRLLTVQLDQPIKFWAGQYLDLTLPDGGVTRSFSMASTPASPTRLEFIIKLYPNGAFSSRLDGAIKPGDRLVAKGPYGTCFRRDGRSGPMLLLGGGSGMSPLLAILRDHIASGEQRPVRFFYGARTQADLFLLDEFKAAAERLADFAFVPALSHADDDPSWQGERGFVHEVALRRMRAEALPGEIDAYACGPAPMIEAAAPVFSMLGVEADHIHYDKFTPATR